MAQLDLQPIEASASALDLQPITEDVVSARPTKSRWEEFKENAIGNAAAVQDLVGSIPGFIGAGTAAGVQALQGNKANRTFPQVVEEVMQSAVKGNVVDYLAPASSLEAARQTHGYETANKWLMAPFQGWGNIAGFLGDTATNDPEFAADLGERLMAGNLTVGALAGFVGNVGPKRGTPEFYRNLQKEIQKGSLDLVPIEGSRDSYTAPPDSGCPCSTTSCRTSGG